MSTVVQQLADKINAEPYSQAEMKKRKPSGKHPYKPQMATKVKWALEESLDKAMKAQQQMAKVWQKLEEIQAMFDGHDRLSSSNYDFLVRVYTQIGKLEHELHGLSLEVQDSERMARTTLAEAKAEKKQAPQ